MRKSEKESSGALDVIGFVKDLGRVPLSNLNGGRDSSIRL